MKRFSRRVTSEYFRRKKGGEGKERREEEKEGESRERDTGRNPFAVCNKNWRGLLWLQGKHSSDIVAGRRGRMTVFKKKN